MSDPLTVRSFVTEVARAEIFTRLNRTLLLGFRKGSPLNPDAVRTVRIFCEDMPEAMRRAKAILNVGNLPGATKTVYLQQDFKKTIDDYALVYGGAAGRMLDTLLGEATPFTLEMTRSEERRVQERLKLYASDPMTGQF